MLAVDVAGGSSLKEGPRKLLLFDSRRESHSSSTGSCSRLTAVAEFRRSAITSRALSSSLVSFLLKESSLDKAGTDKESSGST